MMGLAWRGEGYQLELGAILPVTQRPFLSREHQLELGAILPVTQRFPGRRRMK
jgi:hypothetical protein